MFLTLEMLSHMICPLIRSSNLTMQLFGLFVITFAVTMNIVVIPESPKFLFAKGHTKEA